MSWEKYPTWLRKNGSLQQSEGTVQDIIRQRTIQTSCDCSCRVMASVQQRTEAVDRVITIYHTTDGACHAAVRAQWNAFSPEHRGAESHGRSLPWGSDLCSHCWDLNLWWFDFCLLTKNCLMLLRGRSSLGDRRFHTQLFQSKVNHCVRSWLKEVASTKTRCHSNIF